MHGDIREVVARFYTELTQRLLGGAINHDHRNVPCDIVHVNIDASVEVKAAGTPEHPFIFLEQLENHLKAATVFPNPETVLYALWRYHNGIAKRIKREGEADLISNSRRLAKQAKNEEKLIDFLAEETLTLYIVDARILQLMSLCEGGTVRRLRWNKNADIVAGGVTALKKILKEPVKCIGEINLEIRESAPELILDPKNFASREMECQLTFQKRAMGFPAALIVEREMMAKLETDSKTLKRFFPKKT